MEENYLKHARDFSREKLGDVTAELAEAATLVKDKACVYVTGSYGRLEAGEASDLDLFIVSKTKSDDHEKDRLLTGLDEIRLKYQLVDAVEKKGLPEFDGDGKYLECHTFDEFIEHLGGREDDARNTLTGRLLLLLESKPLVGDEVYEELIDHVLSRYFLDFDENTEDFSPTFLFNDILRMWRTFCVNYENRRKQNDRKLKVKNLKLKFSRMLTCYSAILYILDVYSRKKTVTKEDVATMVVSTPVERLEHVQDLRGPESLVGDAIKNALTEYNKFLKFSHSYKEGDEFDSESWRRSSYAFGEHVETALSAIGQVDGVNTHLFRMILI